MTSSNRWTGGATVENAMAVSSWKGTDSTRRKRRVKRSKRRRRVHTFDSTISRCASPKKNSDVRASTRNPPFIHRFSTLDRRWGRDYPWNFMTVRKFAGTFIVLCLLIGAHGASAQDATLFRVFLKDGSSLVSYGEVAHVGDRVVFSMPTTTGANPTLHLVNIAADSIDWDRTERYAASARSGRYIETQAENDYALLSNQVAEALNQVATTDDPARRLAVVEDARKTLAEWPSNHYNYREADIRQLLTMLDVAIADLRASSGQRRFDLNLVAFATPPPPTEPLLRAPTLRWSIEQVLTVGRLSESSSDRV